MNREGNACHCRDGPCVLPEGDHHDRPPGRRQFSLRSLVFLLTISAAVLGFGRLIHLSPVDLTCLLLLTIALWWLYAEVRFEVSRQHMPDQGVLREEVDLWKREGGGTDGPTQSQREPTRTDISTRRSP